MTLEQVMFGVAFVVSLGFAIAMLFARSAVHVALYLVGVQVALAVTFLMQGAFFIAAVQIIVYAGAVMVTFLFVMMLLGVDRKEVLDEPLGGQRPLAYGLGLVMAAELMFLAVRGVDFVVSGGGSSLEQINRDPGNVKALAHALFGKYLFPFELTSVLLVVAIVGVMAMARRLASSSAMPARSKPEKEEEAA